MILPAAIKNTCEELVSFAKTIRKIDEELTLCSKTIIVIPQINTIIQRYQTDPNTYLSRELDWKISFPPDWSLYPDPDGQFATIRNENKLTDSDHMEVKLIVKDAQGINCEAYYRQCKNEVTFDYKIVAARIYRELDTFILLSRKIELESAVYKLQKYIMHKGKIYIIAINGLRPDYLTVQPGWVKDLKYITGSFAFFEKNNL